MWSRMNASKQLHLHLRQSCRIPIGDKNLDTIPSYCSSTCAWEHHTTDEYTRFIKEFGEVMKFGDGLSDEQAEKTRKLIFLYRKIISLDQKTPKPIKGVECRLHFKSSRPTPHVQGLRRLSPSDKDIHHEMTHKMLTNNIVEYADSEWAAGVVLAKKKGAT